MIEAVRETVIAFVSKVPMAQRMAGGNWKVWLNPEDFDAVVAEDDADRKKNPARANQPPIGDFHGLVMDKADGIAPSTLRITCGETVVGDAVAFVKIGKPAKK